MGYSPGNKYDYVFFTADTDEDAQQIATEFGAKGFRMVRWYLREYDGSVKIHVAMERPYRR